MRIIGGDLKGRRFNPPIKKWPTRPTTDFAREALFNILANQIDFDECLALDLFGGTGGHSLELISRGAAHVTYVDKYYGCCKFLNDVNKELSLDNKLKVTKSDVLRFLKSTKEEYNYIFADPPFDSKNLADIPNQIFQSGVLSEEGLFVLEHGTNQNFLEHPNFIELRSYGTVNFSFFKSI